MITTKLGFLFTVITFTNGLYDSNDDVIELTASNFKNKVLDNDELWLVEFYAPWCGHCRNLAPEWKKAAEALKGIVHVAAVNIDANQKLKEKYDISRTPVIGAFAYNKSKMNIFEGAVDMDVHQSVGQPYGIRGFPTIKAFGFDKSRPIDYSGGRTADSIQDFAFKQLRDMVKERQGGSKKSGSGGSGGGRKESSENHVVTLTDSNFKELVLDSNEPWLVEFYAPWCGHCKRLEPVWKSAANELKEKVGDAVKMGALDATAHSQMASRYGVRGYPTIKIFRKGAKDTPEDFEGGRDQSSILSTAMELYEENIEPPSIYELTSASVLEENCVGKQACIIAFLPHILDSGADGRQRILDLMAKMAEKFKKRIWGWMWSEGRKQLEFEEKLGAGGSGYPAMVIVVDKKKMFSHLTGPFNEEGLDTFLSALSSGRAGRSSAMLPDGKLPNVVDTEPWDGKDGQLPEEDDIDLSDFKWDDEL